MSHPGKGKCRKRRKNLCLSNDAEELGKLLAAEDGRSFSNYVEHLIAKEAVRTGLAPKCRVDQEVAA